MDANRSGIRGRGASGNPQGRFDRLRRAAESPPDAIAPGPATVVIARQAKSIVSRNDSPDIPFSQSINPYLGCEHGCVYCYARPGHAALGLSPGLDFETRIFAKANAAELLRAELSRPGYRCEAIAIGANTDPYQPVERGRRITRSIIQVLSEFRHPLSIITKSALVERDIDLLAPMAADGLAQIFVSVTTLDGDLARKMEPRAAAPVRRIETIRRLAAGAIPCGVLVAPVIPFLNDRDLERILREARQAGASLAGYQVLRLPYELKEIFKDWLDLHFPDKAQHVMARLRDMRGGRDNDPEFGSRMTGEGRYAGLLRDRFGIACRRLGLNGGDRPRPDTGRFRIPGPSQLMLL